MDAQELMDTGYASLLVAESEKCKALDRLNFTKLICSSDFQHYMSTVGNPALGELGERCLQEEHEARVEFDQLVTRKAHQEFTSSAMQQQLKVLEDFTRQDLVWKYMTMSKAVAAVEEEVAKVKSSNNIKSKEFEERLKQIQQKH